MQKNISRAERKMLDRFLVRADQASNTSSTKQKRPKEKHVKVLLGMTMAAGGERAAEVHEVDCCNLREVEVFLRHVERYTANMAQTASIMSGMVQELKAKNLIDGYDASEKLRLMKVAMDERDKEIVAHKEECRKLREQNYALSQRNAGLEEAVRQLSTSTGFN